MIGQQVTVIGAGIGGLSVALALAMRGAQVRVLEQARQISEVGAGVQIGPNGMAVLRALGLDAALAARSVRARSVRLLDYRKAAPVLRLDLANLRPDQPYLFVHRADLIDVLADAARAMGVEIALGQTVASVEPIGDRVRLGLLDGTVLEPSVVIAADGVNSVARPALGDVPTAAFTGQVAWRATVPMGAQQDPDVRVFMGPGRHLVAYPLRDGRLMNLVAVQERHDWAAEGWQVRDDPANMQAAFAGFAPEARALLAQVTDVHLWGLFRHPVAEHWHRGRLALLGDAVHPTLPFLAQGACMALEDAWVLADSLSQGSDITSGFSAFQARRRARCVRIVASAGFNARAYHLSWPPLRLAAHSALRLGGWLAPSAPLRRFDWLYGCDVTAG
ncbi:monooxygenase [Pseudoruegeria sp. SK021]|nr:FAD-dependent monooxygenase [Pseudoruegeria sp. SK021]OSP55507.1 monooxygenase [Pseudoruegeria sp. SK021]